MVNSSQLTAVLANMVLDGIESIVVKHRKVIRKVTNGVIYRKGLNFNFIRYADGFVIIEDNPKVSTRINLIR